jgi:uncharacterized cupin superfamily protein
VTWFIANIRDQTWHDSPAGDTYSDWQQGGHFEQVGINISVVQPGRPVAMYHRESRQEGFLILAGECILIVEGEERRLKAWDYFHCPAGTDHIVVGAEEPAVMIGIGARFGPKEIVYPVDPVAAKHGACVSVETTSPQEAYASFPEAVDVPFREEFLPA